MSEWLQIRIAIESDERVWKIADETGQSIAEVVLALIRFWGWWSLNSATGTVTLPSRSASRSRHAAVTPCAQFLQILDAHCRVPGLCEAMQKVGWLRATNSEITIPDWDRYLSQGAKARALTAKRAARYRASRSRHAQVTRAPLRQRDAIDKRESILDITDVISSDMPQSGTPESAQKPTTKRAPTTPRKPREPDPIWDAVAAIWFGGTVIPSQATRVGRVVRDLKALEATPDDIADRHERQRDEWGDAGATPESLVKHWHQFGPDRKPPNGRHEEISPARIQAEPGKYDHIRPINAKGKT